MAVPMDAVNKFWAQVGEFLAVVRGLRELDQEYIALDLGNVLVDGDFADKDITRAQFVNMVASVETLLTAITAQHTSLYTGSDGSQRP